MSQQSIPEEKLKPIERKALFLLKNKLDENGGSTSISLREFATLCGYVDRQSKPSPTKAKTALKRFEELQYIRWKPSKGSAPSTITWLDRPLPFSDDEFVSTSAIDPHYIERSIDRGLREKLQTSTRNTNKAELIKIKGAQGSGKTFLLQQLFNQLQPTQAVCLINLRKERFRDEGILSNFNDFLYVFTKSIMKELEREIYPSQPTDLKEYWKEELSPGDKCTNYLQENIFAKILKPKTLLINNFDAILGHEAIQEPFINLVRDWHESEMKFPKPNQTIVWPYIVIAYSYGEYALYGVTDSVLDNTGIEYELPEFQTKEVIQLADTYVLKWDEAKTNMLVDLLGGNPELLNIAFKELQNGESLEAVIQTAAQLDSPFRNHLLKRYNFIQDDKNTKIKRCFQQILRGETCIDNLSKVQLLRMGLIKIDNGKPEIKCQLYKQYFQDLMDKNE